jgi:hypothetical protein
MRTSVTSRRLGAGALVGCLLVVGSIVACKSAGIIEVYTAGSLGETDRRTEFFPGEHVTCFAKLASSRDGVRVRYGLRVLEIDGQKGNFGVFPFGEGLQDKTKGGNATPKDLPVSTIQARLDHPARIVTQPDAVDDGTAVALAQDIYDTFIDHLNDRASHTAGRIDPILPLVQGISRCSRIEAAASPQNCSSMLNDLKALFAIHIANGIIHDPPDGLHDIKASDALVQQQNQPPPPLPFVQISTYPLATDFKYKLTGHIFNVREEPVLVAGRFRCEVSFDDDTASADFTITKGFQQKPPTDPQIPVQGRCTFDTVAYCPDPNKGVNVLRCCTFDGTCGAAPKGIPYCAPNP